MSGLGLGLTKIARFLTNVDLIKQHIFVQKYLHPIHKQCSILIHASSNETSTVISQTAWYKESYTSCLMKQTNA